MPDPGKFRLVSFDKMLATMKRTAVLSVAISKVVTCFRPHRHYVREI